MSIFLWGCILRLSVASFADDADLQLLQTRISEKGPELGWTQAGLLTSAGENKCLNLESAGWSNWDCNGLEGRAAAVPSYCKTTNSDYKRAVIENCCKDECAVLAAAQAKSEKETQCLQDSGSNNWTGWDCEGLIAGTQAAEYASFTRKAATPGLCLSTDAATKTAVRGCCKDACTGATLPFDVATAEGQGKCLSEYAGLSDTSVCPIGGSVSPGLCNSSGYTVANWVMTSRAKTIAVDSLCCVEDCHWKAEELLTSVGENKCLNLESGGWSNWDCNGLEGRSAAVPSYCETTNADYRRAVVENCCKDECDFLAAAKAKSEQETQCLNNYSSDWDLWDCEGIAKGSTLADHAGYTRFAATPAFCKYTDDCHITAAVTKCCPDFCKDGALSVGFPDMDFSEGSVVMKKVAIPLPNVSTVEGQQLCLATYGGFSTTAVCDITASGTVTPSSCNSSAQSSTADVRQVRAADSLCCQDDCNWKAEELLTSVGEHKCLNLESGGWSNWDCNGVNGRSAAVPSYCKTKDTDYKRAVPENCCKDECAVLAAAQAKSEEETQCLNTLSSDWDGWDCEGISEDSRLKAYTGFKRKAAAPAFCNHSNNCEFTTAVGVCCAKVCAAERKYYPDLLASEGPVFLTRTKSIEPPDVSTPEGQGKCLSDYGGFSDTSVCSFGLGYCNSTLQASNTDFEKIRAVDTVCCQGQCRWTAEELKTSDGQNKCMNLESGGWSNWDCDGQNGRSAAVPSYCDTTNTDYKRAMETCCATQCGFPSKTIPPRALPPPCKFTTTAAPKTTATTTTTTVSRCGASMGGPPTTTTPATTTTKKLDLTTSDGQTLCLNTHSSGWTNWDCEGIGGKNPATPEYCNSANAEYRKAVADICCAPYCATVSTTTTTTIPGGDTNPGGPDCFGAIARWGPDFDCNEKTDMFCGNDSPDGLDVSLCCQGHCGTKQEKRSKIKEVEGDRKASEGTRKSGRAESTTKRKEAESARKKQNKEDEWLSKRGRQETQNKNTEDERKTKRGFSADKKANERAWKKGRSAAKAAAEKRENIRKNARATTKREKTNKASQAEKKQKANNNNDAQKKAEIFAKKSLKKEKRGKATEAKKKKKRDATKKKKEKRAKASAAN